MKGYTKIIIVLILIAVILFIVFYNKRGNEGTNEEVFKGKIEIITDESHKPQLKLAASKFQLLHQKVNIDVIAMNDINNNIKSILNSSKYNADIITVGDSYVKYVLSESSDKVLEVASLINPYKNIMLNNKIDNDTIEGKIYAVPWDTYPKALIYRKDIFSKQGIDVSSIKTWSDYIEAGRKVSKSTGDIFIGNYQGDKSNIFLLLSNQLGTSYFNKNGELDFQSSKWSRVVEILKILYGEGLIKDFNSESEVMASAQAGKLVSFIGDPTYAINLMKYSQDAGKWGIMKLPAFELGGNRDVSQGGVNLLINKNTSSSQLVQEFIKFTLTDDELQMDLLNQYGRFPVNTNVYNFVNFNKNISYFNSTIWNLFAGVEQGSFSINYTKKFPEVKEITQDILTSDNIKNQDFKVIAENIEKSMKNK